MRTPLARSRGRVPTAELAEHEAALIEAASVLFRAHGYAGVSIDMITRAAGVSPKTIYARHGGKLGLFTAVVDAMLQVPLAMFAELAGEGDPAQALKAFALGLLDYVLRPEVLAIQRILIAEAMHLPELARIFYDHGPSKGFTTLATYLDKMAAEGRLAVDDAHRSAEAFVSLVEGETVRRAMMLHITMGEREREAAVDYAVALFLRAHESPSPPPA